MKLSTLEGGGGQEIILPIGTLVEIYETRVTATRRLAELMNEKLEDDKTWFVVIRNKHSSALFSTI